MSSQPEARLPVLLVVKGIVAGHTFPLRRSHCLIGRDDDVDLKLPDLAISRHHALVLLDADGTVSVRDLGSSNGTRINGTRLSSERPLAEGDEIALGSGTVLKLTYEPTPHP